MVDLSIRKNEHCIVGQPACGYTYNSARSCFIAYGYNTSRMEIDLLRGILEKETFEVFEAGSDLEPGKFVFCTKICSKIILSRFCIVMLNSDNIDGRLQPNANVNMEYGLILGHNKYVVPFHRDDQSLPFNVSGLDTIKYNQGNFSQRAAAAIREAIKQTNPTEAAPIDTNQALETFILSRHLTIADITIPDNKAIFELGRPFGLNLLLTFDGLSYVYFGNFANLRTEAILFRLQSLSKLVLGRFIAIDIRVSKGMADQRSAKIAKEIVANLKLSILVASEEIKSSIARETEKFNPKLIPPLEIFTLSDIDKIAATIL